MKIDVVLLTALQIERDAIVKYLDQRQQRSHSGLLYHSGKLGPYSVVILPLFGMGNTLAASAAARAISVMESCTYHLDWHSSRRLKGTGAVSRRRLGGRAGRGLRVS